MLRLSPSATVHVPSLDLAPLEPGDSVPWLPNWLTVGRLQGGFATLDKERAQSVFWQRTQMPLVIGWREEDGPPPAQEPIEVGGRPAICWGTRVRWMVVVSRPGAQPWLVGGLCSREELLRVAASLP